MSASSTIRDAFTEQTENAPFFSSNGFPKSTGSGALQTPFYVDDKGHFNFGYGLDITVNRVGPFLSWLKTSGLSSADQGVLTTQLSLYLSGKITLSTLNSTIGLRDWRPIAQGVMDNYYADKVDGSSGLSGDLGQYGFSASAITNLQANSPHIWAALEDLKYNAPNAIYDQRPTITNAQG